MGEPRQKEVSRRSVIVALALTCVVLIGALASLIAYYTYVISKKDILINNLRWEVNNSRHYLSILNETISALNEEIARKESEVNNLRAQVANLTEQIVYLSAEISIQQERISWLETEVSELRAITHLEKAKVIASYETVTQPPGSAKLWELYASYAGYVVIQVHYSTTDKTYVETQVYSDTIGATYAFSWENISSGGTTVIVPVLPGLMRVYVGNRDPLMNANITVSITYYY